MNIFISGANRILGFNYKHFRVFLKTSWVSKSSVDRQLVRQLVHSRAVDNIFLPFPLWWTETIRRCEKFFNFFMQYCNSHSLVAYGLNVLLSIFSSNDLYSAKVSCVYVFLALPFFYGKMLVISWWNVISKTLTSN